MAIGTYINLALKEIIRRRRRTLYTMSGIILSAALLSSTFLVTLCLKSSFSNTLDSVGVDIVVQTHGDPCVWAPVKLPTNLNPIPVENIEKVKKIQGVKQASGILICWAFDGEEGNLHPAVIAGVEPWERDLGPMRMTEREGSGNWMVLGRYLNDLDVYAAVIDDDFAKFLNVGIGSFVPFGGNKFEVVGIIKTGREARIAGAQAFVPLRTAQELLKKGNVVDMIFVKLHNNADTKKIISELKNIFVKNSSVTTSYDFPVLVSGLSIFTNLFMFGILIFIVAVAIGFSMRSIAGSVSERIKEICIMKAVGWQNKNIRKVLLTEAFVTGFFSSAIGGASGFLFSMVYINSVSLQLPEYLINYPPCASTPAKIDVLITGSMPNAAIIVSIAVVLTLLCMLASLIASRGFKKLECAEGMRRI